MPKRRNQYINTNNEYSVGLITSIPSFKIPRGAGSSVVNVIPDEQGKIGIREGSEVFGTGLSGNEPINSGFSFSKRDGTEYAVIVDDGGTMYWLQSGEDKWWTLKTGLDAGSKWGFREVNTTTNDQVFGGNGVDNFSQWIVATTNLTSALSGGEVTINVSDTSDFPATGTIIYNGTEIAYTGKTATTFTVASAHASAGSDDGVANEFDTTTYSTQPKGNILALFRDRLYVSGLEGSGNLITGSAAGNYTDFTTSGVGGRVLINIVEGKGNITGLGVKDSRLVSFKTNAIIPIVITQTDLTNEFVEIKPLIIGEDAGVDNFQAIVGGDNANLFFVSGDGGLKELDSVPENNSFRPLLLSQPIAPTIRDWGFGDCKLIEYKSQFFAAAKESDGSTFNDVVEYFNILNGKRYLAVLKGLNVGIWFVLDNKLRFGSSVKTETYTLFEGFDDDGAPIDARFRGKRDKFDLPFKKKKAYYYAVYGEISQNTDLKVTVFYNQGRIAQREYIIKGDGSSTSLGRYVDATPTFAYADVVYGDSEYGGENSDTLREFIAYLPLPNDLHAYDIQVEYSTQAEGARWNLLDEGISLLLKDSTPKQRRIGTS